MASTTSTALVPYVSKIPAPTKQQPVGHKADGPILKPVKACHLNLPANPDLQNLVQSIQDRASYHALVIKNTSSLADQGLLQLAANETKTPVYHADLSRVVLLSERAKVTARLLHELQRVDRRGPATLLISWDQALAQIPLAEMQDAVSRIHRARPDVKIIISTPRTTLSALGNDLEIRDLARSGWNAEDVGITKQVEQALQKAEVALSAVEAKPLLRGLPPSDVSAVLHHARILGQRRHPDAPKASQVTLGELRSAIQDLRDTERNVAQQLKATDLTPGEALQFAKSFLKPTSDSTTLKDTIVGTAPGILSFIRFMKNFERYKKLVPKASKTLLMKGPPGTGKTTLAAALASELGYPLFVPESSKLVDAHMGASANNVYKLFDGLAEYARMNNTPVILFIDEIDSMLTARGGVGTRNIDREYGRVVNAFNEKLDGICSAESRDNIIVVAATNLAANLDDAILRRFHNKVEVGLPDESTLTGIFSLHLGKCASAVTDAQVRNIVHGVFSKKYKFSGADAALAVEKAGLHAGDADREEITEEDLRFGVETLHTEKQKKPEQELPESAQSMFL